MYLALFRSELMRETGDEVFILIQAMNIIRRKDLRYLFTVEKNSWKIIFKLHQLIDACQMFRAFTLYEYKDNSR